MKKLNIIYEDKDLIIVEKEANLLTIKDNKGHKSLYEEVSNYVKKQNKNNKIFIVHRLDKETSGLVLFAKSMKVKQYLQNNWSDVYREYVAIVEGHMPKMNDQLINYLKETKTYQVYISKEGQKAITNYEVIRENKKYSFLKINIETGRKNQIRVQLSYLGNPILGDKKYGTKNNSLNRLALHANKLIFVHPKTHTKIIVESKIPMEFNNLFVV